MAIRSIPIRDQLVGFRLKELKNANINVMVPQNASVGESVDVAVYFLDSDATGYVNISVGTEFNESYAIESGSVRTTITGLTAGSKTVVVRYMGDSNYKASIYTATFSVTKPTVSSFPIRYMQKTYPNDYKTMTSVPQATIDYLNSIRPDRLTSLCDGCKALTSIDLTGVDVSNSINLRYLLYSCEALTSIDLSTFDTSKVQFMEGIFYHNYAATVIDISGWVSTSVVASDAMELMFSSTNNLQYLIIDGPFFNMVDANCGFGSNGINSTCKILVPRDLLDTYKTATNWSTIASHFYSVEDYVITRSNGGVTVTAN